MIVVDGDLIKLAEQGEFDVIIHGCNCFCTMGAGIAKTIKGKYPQAYIADKNTESGAREKLGSYSAVDVQAGEYKFTIVNAYTQFHWRGAGVKADYEAIRSVMKQIKTNYSGSRIGYPLIGAGLAGGDWEVISAIISEELNGESHTLVKFMS